MPGANTGTRRTLPANARGARCDAWYSSYASRRAADTYAVGLPADRHRESRRPVSRYTTRMAILTAREADRSPPHEGDRSPTRFGR